MTQTAAKRIRQAGEVLATLSAGMAAISLWSWLAGISDLFMISTRDRPPSPASLVLLMLLCSSAFALGRWPHRVATRVFGLLVSAAALARGLMALAHPWTGEAVSPGGPLAGHFTQVVGVEAAQMTVWSGAVMVLAAAALGLRLFSGGRNPRLNRISYVLAGLIAGSCILAVVVGVIFGSLPRVLGAVPMSLWSATASVLMGLALLCSLAASNRHISAPPDAPAERPRSTGIVALLVSVLIAAVIALAGAAYLRFALVEEREHACEMLKAIGDLKASEIAHWRAERLAEAALFAKADFVARDTRAFLAHPESPDARDRVLQWLTLLQGGGRYESAELFDAALASRMRVPEQAGARRDAHERELAGVLSGGEITVVDLHAGPDDGRPHMAILLPVPSPADAARSADGRPPRPQGVVMLRIDPRRFLYPLIQNWPTPSQSSETALLRREGGDVVFLNELRHRKGSAMTQRMRIQDRPASPGAMAVLGHVGLLEGEDYRGVRVLAATRRVPDSPWVMLAKVDRAEIFAPLYGQARSTLALTALLVLASWLITRLLRKQREAHFVRKELAAEQQRRALAERLEHLMKGANDAIIIADQALRIIEWNDKALALFGYRSGEMASLTLPDLRPPEGRANSTYSAPAVRGADGTTYETQYMRKDGTRFPAEVSLRVISMDQEVYFLSIVRDITQRKAQEREIGRLNRLYETLGMLNETLVRVKSREELFAEACRIIVDRAGFKLVWIGMVLDDSMEVVPVAKAGDSRAYLDDVRFFADERPGGSGPAGLCILEERPSLFNDFQSDPRSAPWHAAAAACGIRAALGLPLSSDGRVCGALSVCSSEPHVFRDKEISLLKRIAAGISFMLDHLSQQAKKQEAENRMSALISAIPDLLFRVRNDGVILDYHAQRADDLYLPPEGFLGRNLREVLPPAIAGQAVEAMARASATREVVSFEYELEVGGQVRHFEDRVVALSDSESLSVIRNVTLQKQGVRALRESEERFRTLVESVSHIAVQGYGPDGTVRLWNKASEEIYGYTAAEALGRNLVDLIIPPDMKDQVREAIRQMVESENHRSAEELLLMRKDGSRVPVYSNHTVIEVSGRGKELYCLDLDLTERKRAEERLQVMSFAVQSSLDALGLADLAGRITYVNDSFVRMWGCADPGELVGRPVSEFSVTGAQMPEVLKALEEGRGYLGEGSAHRRDGTLFHADFAANPVRTSEGRVVAWMISFVETTDRKREQATLRLQAAALEAAANTIVIASREGKILWANPSFATLTGYTLEEATGKEPGELIKSGRQDDPFSRNLWSTILSGKVWCGEVVNRRKNGDFYTEEMTITPVRNDGEVTHFIAIKQDITEKKSLEAQLLRTQRLESVGRLASGIAHDLNNILMPMLIAPGLLRDQVHDVESLELLNTVEASAKRGAGIIKQLLAFGRGSEGQLQPLDLRTLVKEMIKIIGETFPKDITVARELPEQLPLVDGDLTQLHQVLMNLCVNARDAMPDGGTIRFELQGLTVGPATVAANPGAKPGEHVMLRVADTGTGIAPDILDKIFDPFFTTKQIGEGTGLGLSTVVGIVRNHRGFIQVDSKVGKGTSFKIFLPVSSAHRVEEGRKAADPMPAGHGELVLVVDDEEYTRQTTRMILKHRNYRLLEATNGVEGLEVFMANRDKIHVVLTDIAMPEMGGADLIRALREASPDVRIIAMSGHLMQPELSGESNQRVDAVLSKPFVSAALLQALQKVLAANKG